MCGIVQHTVKEFLNQRPSPLSLESMKDKDILFLKLLRCPLRSSPEGQML